MGSRRNAQLEYQGREAVVASVISTLIASGARTATKYVASNLTVRATRRRFAKKISPHLPIDLVVTIGPPNHEARERIAQAKRAKERFPLPGIELRGGPR